MKPEKAQRIARLFQDGWGLDRISELGLIDGWTRADARQVAIDRGWSLDWNGRLDPKFLGVEVDQSQDVMDMTQVGVDHEIPYIAELAKTCEKKIDQLRRALIRQEERDTEYSEDRERRRQEHVRRLHEEPRTITHGSWSGYQTHNMTGTPLCGPCEAAGAVILARAQEASARARSERHRAAEGVAS